MKFNAFVFLLNSIFFASCVSGCQTNCCCYSRTRNPNHLRSCHLTMNCCCSSQTTSWTKNCSQSTFASYLAQSD